VAGNTGAGTAFKKKSNHAAEQDRPDVKKARDAWFNQFAQTKLNQLVFIDEFGATTNMTRRYARGPRGQRVVCKTPHGHWKILSTIAALDVNGIRTACCFDGATDTEMFVAFVQTFLVPTLKPGQVVVMDNLAAHKSPHVDQLIEAAGARVLRLPPYSPDFNPIEMAISKMKALLRKLGRRSFHDLEAAIAQATNAITPTDAHAFITHCGYDDTIE
jgi:transposase